MTMARVGVNDEVVVLQRCLEIEGGRITPDVHYCLSAVVSVTKHRRFRSDLLHNGGEKGAESVGPSLKKGEK